MYSSLSWQQETCMKDVNHFLFFALYALKWRRVCQVFGKVPEREGLNDVSVPTLLFLMILLIRESPKIFFFDRVKERE